MMDDDFAVRCGCKGVSSHGSGSLDTVAARVQSASPLRRALLAREALLRTVEGKVPCGQAETRLRRMLILSGRSGMVAISFVLLIGRLWAGRRSASLTNVPDAIFLGIGALRERQLMSDIAKWNGRDPVFVDQRHPRGFSPLPAPPVGGVLRHWRAVIHEALAILARPDLDFARLDVMTALTMRCHELAYLTALFEAVRETRPDVRVYSATADIPAHAACCAGLSVEYHQHGFLARSLVFPDFSAMVALTGHEGRHVVGRVPGLSLRVNVAPISKEVPRAVLAVAGDYIATDPAPVTSLVETALEHGYDVVIRPHPRGNDSLWRDIRGRDGITFENKGDFEAFLAKWRPAFLASWFSTTLLDGLRAGAVPVTFSFGQNVLIFPLLDIALAWPQDSARVEACMADIPCREETLATLSEAALS